jgi:hypothetical protein
MNLTMFKPLIHQALGNMDGLNAIIETEISKIELQEHEKRAAYLIIMKDEKARLITVVLDDSDKITRVVDNVLFTDFIKNLIQENI